MTTDHFTISEWPQEENDSIEFKSSQTSIKDLKEKILKAASAFWNSGGGRFFAGVNQFGIPDGGFPCNIGREPIRDWVDRILHEIVPVGPYKVLSHEVLDQRGTIEKDHVVLEIQFGESRLAPHMAPDKRYYLRAGAHTDPAPHFLVEALWARRSLADAMLRHVLRLKPGNSGVIQMGIVSVTSAPALDVEIKLEPIPEFWSGYPHYFPLQSPLIDKSNSFWFDLSIWHKRNHYVDDTTEILCTYYDVQGQRFEYKRRINVIKELAPFSIGSSFDRDVVKSLQGVEKQLAKIANSTGQKK